MDISVIIPTYNPDISRLNLVLDCLRRQTLPLASWELIVVDNNSACSLSALIDVSWHPYSTVIREEKQGLTYARVSGFLAAKGSIIVLVDDDNLLEDRYLCNTLNVFTAEPGLGAAGGKIVPMFNGIPPGWLKQFYGNLALRDFGETTIINSWSSVYPATAPVGAGLALRSAALPRYIEKVSTRQVLVQDRTGDSLSSGGDNDIVLELLKTGWTVGYFPALCLTHIIPEERWQVDYLKRLIRETNKSWIRLLQSHQICPWKKISRWTVPLRMLKAWFTYKAWKSDANSINWQGACGTFEGLSVDSHKDDQ